MNIEQHEVPNSVEKQLQYIQDSSNLRDVNQFLTRIMAERKIQYLIKGEKLALICDTVVDLALMLKEYDHESNIIAAAILGRLSAVTKSRNNDIFARALELFEEAPPSVETLADGDEKYYATLCIEAIGASWTPKYCHDQVIEIDTSEKARKVLVSIALREANSLSKFWQANKSSLSALSLIENSESRFKRIRRITSTVTRVIKDWQGDVGQDAGLALSDWFSAIFGQGAENADEDVLTDVFDDAQEMLLRIIELRFSNALLAPTYNVLDRARSAFGKQVWGNVLRHSKNLEKIRTSLKETALVLARQRIQDSELMNVVYAVYYSRAQVLPAISSHFSEARDLDPETKAWWEQGGKLNQSHREPEHKMGNSEDKEIGSLLIHVENSKTVMEKLRRAVVPFLEISDPPLAETVKTAAGSYAEIASATRHLATMRKLKHMELKGMILEYDPEQHEMLGGHRLGIRKVKVERDGIQKKFGGKVKILVRPRVSSIK